MCGDSTTHLNLVHYTVIINRLMCDFNPSRKIEFDYVF